MFFKQKEYRNKLTIAWFLRDFFNKNANYRVCFLLCYSLPFSWQDVRRNGLRLLSNWRTLAPVLLCRAETLYLWILQAEFSQRVAVPKIQLPKYLQIFFNMYEAQYIKFFLQCKEQRFLVLSRQSLNSIAWKRSRVSCSLRLAVGGMILKQISSTFEKRQMLKSNYLGRVTHQVIVHNNIWIQMFQTSFCCQGLET